MRGWRAAQFFLWGDAYLSADAVGDGDGFHLAGGAVFADAGGGHTAFSDEGALGIPATDEVADGLVADLFYQQFHFKLLLEKERRMVVAGGVDAWPADAFLGHDLPCAFPDGEVDGAEEGMLSPLHEAEEVREVHDAGHIGVRELHTIGVNVAIGSHEGSCGDRKVKLTLAC